MICQSALVKVICTMLLEQIKGFHHGITTTGPCLPGISKDSYIECM